MFDRSWASAFALTENQERASCHPRFARGVRLLSLRLVTGWLRRAHEGSGSGHEVCRHSSVKQLFVPCAGALWQVSALVRGGMPSIEALE